MVEDRRDQSVPNKVELMVQARNDINAYFGRQSESVLLRIKIGLVTDFLLSTGVYNPHLRFQYELPVQAIEDLSAIEIKKGVSLLDGLRAAYGIQVDSGGTDTRKRGQSSKITIKSIPEEPAETGTLSADAQKAIKIGPDDDTVKAIDSGQQLGTVVLIDNSVTDPYLFEPRTNITMDELRTGGDETFKKFFEQQNSGLLFVATTITGNFSDAEEIVQQSWLSFFKSLDKIKGTPFAYIRQIVINRAISDIRHKIVTRNRGEKLAGVIEDTAIPFFGDGDNESQSPERHTIRTQLAVKEQLLEAIMRLPDRQQDVMILAYMYPGIEEEAKAKALGISRGAVKTHIARARRNLKKDPDLRDLAVELFGKI